MKKCFNFIIVMTALAVFAGASLIFAGFSNRIPRGVFVNGCDVGGLTYSCAEKILRGEEERRLKDQSLEIFAGERVYRYAFPEIYYSDDFAQSLKSISSKGQYFFPVFYYLNGAEEIVNYICNKVEREKVEPYADFNLSGEPFTYHEGCDGAVADRKKALADITAALNGGNSSVHIAVKTVLRSGAVEDIRQNTRKRYSFTTYFDNSNVKRASNIRLAAEKINGTVLGAGEVFSFNKTVGERTPEKGFKEAKIIENGRFVTGTGGGVCQVSTTLYNAALLSGLEIKEYHPHSLAVSYVAPSRDAMVSGSVCDLRIQNNTQTPIYMRVKCSGSSICCTIYGHSDGYEYSFISTVLNADDPAKDSDGITSEGYLVRVKGEEESEVRLVRRDRYMSSR